ncbi:GIY-YIG nuclease family protein [Micromonospora sp. NPDC023644]|uniref:GIY-YIG nuclease family protein n=1 Tax=Micromonospora sp. NPDC023644 TaxID=3154321 RepID=UPI0033C3F67B
MAKRTSKPVRPTGGYSDLAQAVSLGISAGAVHRQRMKELSTALKSLGSVVYFIKFGPYVKIGYSTQLHGRLRALGKPTTDVLAVIPGGYAEEQELHTRFKKARVINELFHATPELVEFINEIRTKAGVEPIRAA